MIEANALRLVDGTRRVVPFNQVASFAEEDELKSRRVRAGVR